MRSFAQPLIYRKVKEEKEIAPVSGNLLRFKLILLKGHKRKQNCASAFE